MKSLSRKQLIKMYIDFFKSNKHAIISGSPLIPENDPSVLFTTAGMHPLVPFLLGQKHPAGKRLADVQKCIRTGDIDLVGDTCHLTFFEMLGNWSLGDYFKKEAIEMSYEFLTAEKYLGIDSKKLSVTVFAGDKDAPKDNESAKIWTSLGISKDRIHFLPKADNWWGPAGQYGPCGPCTEMFIDTGKEKCGKECKPGCSCGKYLEVWNDVFMEYNKTNRLILVDGMHCLYDENFEINQDLLEMINSFNTHCILVVNKFREKGLKLVKNYDSAKDTNWEAFSLEEKEIKKDKPEYFETLLRRFDLTPKEIIYFDHDKKNIETAEKLGILSQHYSDIKSVKKFIENNCNAIIQLSQKNVDTGMGVERTCAILQNKKSVFDLDEFEPIMNAIKELSKKYDIRSARIICDHLKAAVFVLAEETLPSNLDQGYILRRFIRRAIRCGKQIGINKNFTEKIAKIVIKIYKEDYPELEQFENFILVELLKEEDRFRKTLEIGLREFEKISKNVKFISGKDAFLLFQSYGFPIEITEELAAEKNLKVDKESFNKEFEEHQELSRVGSEKRFKGGLSDKNPEATKLHTATHILNQVLRDVLKKKDICQRGSNITPERLRFDFNFDRKLTSEELQEIEKKVNDIIDSKLEVEVEEMSVEQAKKLGAQAMFTAKYSEKVTVYSVGNYSIEICAGPHVDNTEELGHFKIIKEESVAAGIRRIKAKLE